MDMFHTVCNHGTHPAFPKTLLEILFTTKSRLSVTLYRNKHETSKFMNTEKIWLKTLFRFAINKLSKRKPSLVFPLSRYKIGLIFITDD